MNCTNCNSEGGPLPRIAVLLGCELAGEFCSMLCLSQWSIKRLIADFEEEHRSDLRKLQERDSEAPGDPGVGAGGGSVEVLHARVRRDLGSA